METIILAFIISLLAIAGIAVGVLVGRAPVKGSCGGVTCHKGISCGICKAKAQEEAP